MSKSSFIKVKGSKIAAMIASEGYNKSTFANAIGLSRPTITRAILHNEATPETIQEFCMFFGIRAGEVTDEEMLGTGMVSDAHGRSRSSQSLRKRSPYKRRGLLPGQWQLERVRRSMRKRKAATVVIIR